MLNVCLTGWPATDVEKWIGGLLASPVLKLLLYEPRSWIEAPLLWPTGIGCCCWAESRKKKQPSALTLLLCRLGTKKQPQL
jgi:hypothetical protein